LKPTELSIGLYPQAPVFHQREPIADQIDKLAHSKEYFWVIKNGLKMTAMPAWGLSHDDDTIWAMTAFVLKLNGMTAEQYKDLVESTKHSSHDHAHDHP
jgi:mono/diheme cytochrome c family protein